MKKKLGSLKKKKGSNVPRLETLAQTSGFFPTSIYIYIYIYILNNM
jgi:hypothetical protein